MSKCELTAKQKQFCDEYLVDHSAKNAARSAGFELNPTLRAGYYTYALVCPIDGDVFYIGKGKDNRVFNHLKAQGNTSKGKRIARILEAHDSYDYLIMSRHESEREAYAMEYELIKTFGMRLTNISRVRRRDVVVNDGWVKYSSMDMFDTVQEWATITLERYRPYLNQNRFYWMGSPAPEWFEEWFVKELTDISENGWAGDVFAEGVERA
jgi:hypothetical protein